MFLSAFCKSACLIVKIFIKSHCDSCCWTQMAAKSTKHFLKYCLIPKGIIATVLIGPDTFDINLMVSVICWGCILGPKWHSPIGSMTFHRAQKLSNSKAQPLPLALVMDMHASKTLCTARGCLNHRCILVNSFICGEGFLGGRAILVKRLGLSWNFLNNLWGLFIYFWTRILKERLIIIVLYFQILFTFITSYYGSTLNIQANKSGKS
jgi:hypothetical protein